MGTFRGHVLPGLVLLSFGLRWTYCVFWRYFLCLRELESPKGRNRRFKSSLTYPFSCCPGIPMTAVFMIVIAVIFSIGTFITTYHMDLHESSEHIAMHTFFGISAVVMLLKHYGWPVGPDTEYACFTLTFLVNGYLMYRHTAGKPDLEIQVHQDVMIMMFATAVVIALEMKYRYNALLPLCRAFCFSLNGSWTVMQGFILYSPWGAWPLEDHTSHMMATNAFVGHIACHLLLAGLVGAVAFVQVRRLVPAEVSLALDREGIDQQEEMDHKIASKSERSEYLIINSYDEA